MRATLLTAALVLGLAGAAWADTLTLKDGTKLEGTIVEQSSDEIVFEHTVGGAKTKSTFKKSDVKSLEQTFGGKTETKPKKDEPSSPKTYAELEHYKHEVIFLVDRSGSMAINDRYGAALTELDKMLAELPTTTGFGVYLFDTKPVSVFESNSIKTKDPARQRLRKKMEELGGLDRDGFTDIAAALPPAIRARPDAIYILSDGVPTKGELEGEKIVKAVKELLPSKKFPIHVVAVRGGTFAEGLEENDDVARQILRSLAEATGGKYREVEAKPKETSAIKRDPSGKYDVTLHFYARNHEFKERELVFPAFEIEIRDTLYTTGAAVREYASVSLDLVTRTEAGVLFDEVKDLPIAFKEIDAEKKTTFGLGGTLDPGPKSFWSNKIKVVRPQDARDDDAQTNFIKIPSEGGTLEVTYHRGKKEWKKVFAIKVPLTDAKPAK